MKIKNALEKYIEVNRDSGIYIYNTILQLEKKEKEARKMALRNIRIQGDPILTKE